MISRAENELQSWFTTQMDHFLTAHGRRLVGWDEILEGGLAPNAVVMSWRVPRADSPRPALSRRDHDAGRLHLLRSPINRGAPRPEPLAIGGFLPLDSVYAYEPVPAELESQFALRILGAQDKSGPSTSRARRTSSTWLSRARARWPKCSGLPRGGATSDFSARLPAEFARLQALDVNYRSTTKP